MLRSRHWAPALFVFLSSTFFGFPQAMLEKTVSLTPGGPGGAAITVSAGTTVYYTYLLRNGDFGDIVPTAPISWVTLTSHTLTDDKLGTILDFENRTLLPGEAFSVTQSATIDQTTTNTATWLAFAEPVTMTLSSVAAQVLAFTSSASATVFVADQRMGLPIPTLSEWGAIALAVLLLGGGMLFLRRAPAGKAG